MHPNIAALFYVITVLLCANPVHSLPEDRHKAAQIRAQSATFDQSKQSGEFIGDVIIRQGTTTLIAKRVKTITDNRNKLAHAIAYGSKKVLAHYSTLPSSDKTILHAYAREIHYYPKENRIDLIHQAKVIQGKDILQADKISYDTVQQRVLSQSLGDRRVSIIIYPDNKKNA